MEKTPLHAAVREIEEETNVKLDSKEAVSVGTAWTQEFRGKYPDINFAFAFSVDESAHKLIAQEFRNRKNKMAISKRIP